MRRVLRLALALLLGLAVGLRAEETIPPLPMQEVAPGIFVFQAPVALADPENGGAIANIGFIVGAEAVAVIDTGGSLLEGRRLLAAIRARTALPIRYVVNTHVHPDHLLGNAAFLGEGAIIVGHRNLPEALAVRAGHYLAANAALIGPGFAGTRAVPPSLLVADKLALDLGQRRLVLEAWPTAHTNTDLTVFDEATASWFLGDLLFLDHVPALDGSLVGWIATLRRITARPATRAIPGHGLIAISWPAAATPMQLYLDRLEADIRADLKAGRTMQEAASKAGRTEYGQWRLFDAFNARNATTAFHELEWE